MPQACVFEPPGMSRLVNLPVLILTARGSVEDKGQLFLHVKALEAHLATRGKLPVNVVVIAEGEEEIGQRARGLTKEVGSH